MPTTVSEAFAAAGLTPEGVVRWNERPKVTGPGVYVVSLTKSVQQTDATLPYAPLSPSQFDRWLSVCPDLTLYRVRPTAKQLQDQIQHFWIPDEAILYIGLAGSLSGRLAGYYNTPIGAPRPHSGGYFLKLLSNINELWVHYASCSDPETAENKMLGRFCENVSDASRQVLADADHPFPFANLVLPRGTKKAHGLRRARTARTSGVEKGKQAEMSKLADADHPFPFANLEWPRGTKKAHGLRRARTARTSGLEKGKQAEMSKNELSAPSATTALDSHTTQRITSADINDGKIRIPSTGGVKALFSGRREYIDVLLNGELLRVRWDPKMDPDKERSGVLGIGKKLRRMVREDERLSVSVNDLGILSLDSMGTPDKPASSYFKAAAHLGTMLEERLREVEEGRIETVEGDARRTR
jgi:hypothetical protein